MWKGTVLLSSRHDETSIALPNGLYETLIDARLSGLISVLPDTIQTDVKELDPEESHIVLSRYVASALRDVLLRLRGENKILNQVEVCNALLNALQASKAMPVEPGLNIPAQAEQLLAVVERYGAGNARYVSHGTPTRPETPLAMSSLLTGTRVDPSLMSQLIKEMLSVVL